MPDIPSKPQDTRPRGSREWRWIDMRTLAAQLGVRVSTVHRWVQAGHVRGVLRGGVMRLDVASVRAWFEIWAATPAGKRLLATRLTTLRHMASYGQRGNVTDEARARERSSTFGDALLLEATRRAEETG